MDTKSYEEFIKNCEKFITREALERLVQCTSPGFLGYALGLAGEAGEFADRVVKILRDNGGEVDRDTKLSFKKELGDAMWYLTACALDLGLTLEKIMQANHDKIRSRQARGVVHGQGDKR